MSTACINKFENKIRKHFRKLQRMGMGDEDDCEKAEIAAGKFEKIYKKQGETAIKKIILNVVAEEVRDDIHIILAHRISLIKDFDYLQKCSPMKEMFQWYGNHIGYLDELENVTWMSWKTLLG